MNSRNEWLFAILAIAIAAAFIFQHCKKLPDAKETIGVKARDFSRPTAAAMDIWNRAAGCTIFVPGEDVLVLSTDGEPCGKAFHPSISDGHSAGTYKCDALKSFTREYHRWEIHFEQPGDLRTQTCIAIHELGHVLGLPDSERDDETMHVEWCPPDGQLLWPSDVESKAVAKMHCR